MALIKCPECGHMISEYADKCISCGCPMSKIKELAKNDSKKKESSAQKKAKKQKVSFKDSLTKEETVVLNLIGKSISEHNKNYKPHLFNNYFGIKHLEENFFSFWIVKNSKNKFVLKSIIERRANSKIAVREIMLSNWETIIKIINDKIDSFSNVTPLIDTQEDIEKIEEEKYDDLKNFAWSFTNLFERKYKDFEVVEKKNSFLFKFLGHPYSWFYLSIKNNALTLFYRKDPTSHEETFQKRIDIDNETPQQVFEFISSIVDKGNFTLDKRIEYPNIFVPLRKILKSGRINRKDEYVDIAIDVANFVKSELEPYSDKTKFDFFNNQSTNSYTQRMRYLNLYNYSGFTPKDSEDFLKYFISVQIYNVIKKSDDALRNIISSSSELLSSIQEMLNVGEVDFDRCKGVTSRFSLVPQSLLEEVIDKYTIR